MTVALAFSFLVSTTVGVLLLRLVWPRHASPFAPHLAVALGTGLGAGLSAVLLFAWLLAFGPTRGFPLAEAGLLGLVALGSLKRRSRTGRTMPPVRRHPRHPLVLILLAAGFLVTLTAAVAAFVATLRQHPHGEWDAWMNWDLRARMIFRGQEAWRTAFSGTFPWSHPDYPVLVPSSVVRSWLYTGTETVLGPAVVAATFTFGTVALLLTALAALRSVSQGLLAGLILVSTPFFIIHGTSLYADVPLGFFFLATFVFLALDGRYGAATGRFMVLAGVAAGLGMWTKNEGLLFTLAVGGGLLLAGRRDGWAASRRRLTAFGAGALPLLLLVVGFKVAFAPPNDLVATLGVDRTLGRLADPDRYLLVLREYASHIVSFGKNGLGGAVWPLLACLAGLGVSRPETRRGWARTGAVALVLLLAGHFMVFVSMAHELARLLNSSLDRLLLQLWPSALFLFFMVLRTAEEVAAGRALPEHPARARARTRVST